MRVHPVALDFNRVCLVLDQDTVRHEEVAALIPRAEEFRPAFERLGVGLMILSARVDQASLVDACAVSLATPLDDATLIVALTRTEDATELEYTRGKHALRATLPLDSLEKLVACLLEGLVLDASGDFVT